MTEFEEDFEGTDPLANFTVIKQTNGAVSLEANDAKQGSHYLKSVAYEVAAVRRARAEKDFTEKTEVFARVYFRIKRGFPTSDSGRASLLIIQKTAVAASPHISIPVFKNGALKVLYRHGGSLPTQDLGVTIEYDVWYCLEAQVKRGTTDGIARVWLNGEMLFEKLDVNNDDVEGVGDICIGAAYVDSNAHVPEVEVHNDLFAYGSEYIGLYTPPTPPTLTSTMNEMINSMMSVMMLMMVMQMMTSMVKGLKK